MTDHLRVGTRGSTLALAQSGLVADQLVAISGGTAELVRIRTQGDVNQGPLASIGGTGVFVIEVRSRLLAGDVDVIVHSLKDLPTAAADGLSLAAVPVREDPADALCARDGLTIDELPAGASVGTGSPRRAAQLLRLRPDLQVRPIRGNIDTRLGLVTSGTLDAVVLAAAGLSRIGRGAAITQRLDPNLMLPAPAQGALAVECRALDADGSWFAGALRTLDDGGTRAAVVAERTLLAALEAGCTAPVGAYATVSAGQLTLTGAVMAIDGSREIRSRISGPAGSAAELGAQLAAELIDDGAADLLSAAP
ncbi:hydroxymethylbilane synthase [Nakamurella panacisegetis]|uniref:Porphobilinogen deaminase n=1 Tax=Nakamurella panacisegetis TaxID=1090615 RepID=A0A1H0HTI6_9ACTN|nr:hydroxymethylbilane synthase [Nakamurella panacisegetis]SDO22496.1 hydroxymethylbilane synthase [Nakamurella panacisegetis]